MRQILTILLALFFAISVSAQKKKTVPKAKAKTTVVSKKRVVTTTKTAKTTKYSNTSIKSLQSQRATIQKKIKQQEQALRANQATVKKRLRDLMLINSEIDDRQKSIDGIQKDITGIEGNIDILKSQLQTLNSQLDERRAKYIKSLRYMARHRTVQDELMFIFSAKSFTQMYRRLRFVREYAAYQRAQGEILKAKEAQVSSKNHQLETVKGQKNTLLYKSQQEHVALQGKQDEQQKEVQGLRNQQKTIQVVIAQQRKKDAELNAQIDQLVEQEVAKARARAAAEAKRKADAEAAAKQKAIELAKQKAAAEAAAKENARRVAAAKAREEKLKAAAQTATADQEAAADQAAKEAEADRKAAERKAAADAKRNERAIADAKRDVSDATTMSSEDRMMTGGFASNKGRLPMPITGNYKIVSHFGQYNVDGLQNVTLDNKGINILGQPGCAARSVYDGEVSAVFGFDGSMVVMVRHGTYISVYCNLKSVSVRKGQKVSTRQLLGYVGEDNILQFQLRRETAKLNPEAWLGR